MATNVIPLNLFQTFKLISNARNELGETLVLKTLTTLNKVMNYHAGRDSVDVRINQRSDILPLEQRKEHAGKMWVHVWSRDCDMCEAEWVAELNISGFENYCNRMYENAEGPVHISRITYGEYKEYQPVELRDRVLEAFEEGRNFHV